MSKAAQAAMAASYKSLKEEFVSGLSGGDIGEINYVTAVASAAITLWSVLQARQSFFTPYKPLSFAIDFLLNVCAFLLATTLYANTPLLLSMLLLAPVAIVYSLPRTSPPKKPKLPPPSKQNTGSAGTANANTINPFPKKPFLTTYRGQMMVTTCLAILAVDFRIFPRRFAKVETWGTSLMDLGVGSFVFSAGVVGARPVLKEQISGKKGIPLVTRLYQAVRHSVPLLILGFIRLYTVKGLDYAEHVTEYGVHWNFFFTLAFLPPFVAIFQSVFQYIPSYAGLAILLGVAYQVILEYTSLKAYILTAERTDLLSKNREGIFSFFGYLAIFLAGQSTGMIVIPRSISASITNATQQRKRLLLTLAGWSAIWSLLFIATTHYKYGLNLNVSRRIANLPYFLWIAAFNTAQITLFCLIETIFFPAVHKSQSSSPSSSTTSNADTRGVAEDAVYKESTSRVLEAFNRNGLALFLLANLGTGVVNLTVRTLDVKDVVAMGILTTYAGILTGIAVGLDVWDISIKM